MKHYEFHRSLRARGMSLEKLAAAIGLKSHAHVSRVITGRHGKWTRRRLAPLLTERERALLGWDSEGKAVAQSSTGNNVPIGDPPEYHESFWEKVKTQERKTGNESVSREGRD
jgi:hypothetical protein